MTNREKHSEEPAPVVRTAQQPDQVPQAGVNASSPVMWQASSVRVPPVLGSPAGVLMIQQLKGNRAVGQVLAVQKSDEDQGLREPSDEEIHSAAAEGIRTPATTLPFLDRIQESFGRHSIGHVKAHVGPEAAKASRAMNALAFASGDHVVFGGTPDLHTAAHEAAHVVQQQVGVQLVGGIGREDDPYERHADAVADAVVAGRSAGGLLASFWRFAAPPAIRKPSAKLQPHFLPQDEAICGQRKERDNTLSENALSRPTGEKSAIQRVKVNKLDTQDPAVKQEIFDFYLKISLDDLYDISLRLTQELRTLIAEYNRNDIKYFARKDLPDKINITKEHIDVVTIRIVDYESRAMKMDSGIPTVAAAANIYLDGHDIFKSNIKYSGMTNEINTYKLMLGKNPEFKVSQNDAEGQVLTEAENYIKKNLETIFYGHKLLRIEIYSSAGPCDGCKKRIDVFAALLDMIFAKSSLEFEIYVYYKGKSELVNRGSRTRYGWEGDRFFNAYGKGNERSEMFIHEIEPEKSNKYLTSFFSIPDALLNQQNLPLKMEEEEAPSAS